MRRHRVKSCLYGIISLVLTFSSGRMWGDAILSFRVAWGNRPEQLGIVQGPELERVGPLTFAVAPDGQIYVADTVHCQVKRWQSDGTFGGVVLENVRPNALSVGESGALLLLTKHKIDVFTPGGQLLAEVVVPEQVPLVEGYGQDIWEEEGRLCVNDPEELTYCLRMTERTPTTASAVVAGRPAGKNDRIMVFGGGKGARACKMSFSDAGKMARGGNLEDDKTLIFFDPRTVRRQTGTNTRGALLFRGNWEKPYRYVFEMEEINDRDVKLMIVATSDGKSFSRLELPNSYYTTIYKKTEVMADGDVWQMLTTPQGVEFVRWRAPQ